MTRLKRSSNLEEAGTSVLGSAALQSSWIQRLKRGATALHGEDSEEVQIPLKKLAIEEDLGWKNNLVFRINMDNNRLLINQPRTRPRIEKETGWSHRGLGKPPLPPSRSPSKDSGDARKRNFLGGINRVKVHALDVRLEKLHRLHQDGTRAVPRDLLAEFASRLDIKEKSTPVGFFHLAERKVRCPLPPPGPPPPPHPWLTPVLSVHAPVIKAGPSGHEFSSTTASLPPEVLGLSKREQASSRGSGAGGAKGFSPVTSVEGNVSHRSLAGTLSTACCGSSPFPDVEKNDVRETEVIMRDVDEVSLTCGKRRPINVIDEERIVNMNGVVKRSRLCVEGGQGGLSGPWLNRWTTTTNNGSGVRVFGNRRLADYKGETPSAAAMAIVGAAVKRFQS